MNASQLLLLNELSKSTVAPGVKESAKNLLSALKNSADDIIADPVKRKAALSVAGLTAGVGAIGSLTGDDDNGYGGRRGPYKVEYY